MSLILQVKISLLTASKINLWLYEYLQFFSPLGSYSKSSFIITKVIYSSLILNPLIYTVFLCFWKKKSINTLNKR